MERPSVQSEEGKTEIVVPSRLSFTKTKARYGRNRSPRMPGDYYSSRDSRVKQTGRLPRTTMAIRNPPVYPKNKRVQTFLKPSPNLLHRKRRRPHRGFTYARVPRTESQMEGLVSRRAIHSSTGYGLLYESLRACGVEDRTSWRCLIRRRSAGRHA